MPTTADPAYATDHPHPEPHLSGPSRPPYPLLADTVITVATGGPHTIVGPGEQCLLCDEPLGAGEVYLFVRRHGRHGVAHEECTEEAAAASGARRQAQGPRTGVRGPCASLRG